MNSLLNEERHVSSIQFKNVIKRKQNSNQDRYAHISDNCLVVWSFEQIAGASAKFLKDSNARSKPDHEWNIFEAGLVLSSVPNSIGKESALPRRGKRMARSSKWAWTTHTAVPPVICFNTFCHNRQNLKIIRHHAHRTNDEAKWKKILRDMCQQSPPPAEKTDTTHSLHMKNEKTPNETATIVWRKIQQILLQNADLDDSSARFTSRQ